MSEDASSGASESLPPYLAHAELCPQSLRREVAPRQNISQLRKSSTLFFTKLTSWRCLMTHTHIRRCVLLLAALLAVLAVSASANTLIWGGNTSYQGYFIDPTSGVTFPAPGGILTFGASSSPYSGWVFVTTPVNIWKVPVLGVGSPQVLGGCSDCVDLAYDPGSDTLYDIGFGGQLYTVDYSCPGFNCWLTPLGASMPGVQGIDYVPGRGIYGADIDGGLWLLNPQTLQLSYIGFTDIFGITDLAYDSFTQRLIAVSVGMKCSEPFCGPQTGMIWSINPRTAQAVLLNGNAPPIYGLAEITPEPESLVLFTTGAIGFLVAIRRRVLG